MGCAFSVALSLAGDWRTLVAGSASWTASWSSGALAVLIIAGAASGAAATGLAGSFTCSWSSGALAVLIIAGAASGTAATGLAACLT